MKKLLFLAAASTAIYGAYAYIKGQVKLALTSDYSVSDFEIINLTDERVDVKAEIKLSNKSAFEITIQEYDITLFYKNIQIGYSESGTPFKIYAENSVKIPVSGTIMMKDVKSAIMPFVTNVLQRQPINIQVTGHVKVKFLGVPYTLEFDKEEFNYSMDLIKDMGFAQKYENLQAKIPFLRKI